MNTHQNPLADLKPLTYSIVHATSSSSAPAAAPGAHLQSAGTGRPRLLHSPINMRASKPPLCATMVGGMCTIAWPPPSLLLSELLLPAVMKACRRGASWPKVGLLGSCCAWLLLPHTCVTTQAACQHQWLSHEAPVLVPTSLTQSTSQAMPNTATVASGPPLT